MREDELSPTEERLIGTLDCTFAERHDMLLNQRVCATRARRRGGEGALVPSSLEEECSFITFLPQVRSHACPPVTSAECSHHVLSSLTAGSGGRFEASAEESGGRQAVALMKPYGVAAVEGILC